MTRGQCLYFLAAPPPPPPPPPPHASSATRGFAPSPGSRRHDYPGRY
jgi:hypothetical protein